MNYFCFKNNILLKHIKFLNDPNEAYKYYMLFLPDRIVM